MAVLSDQREPVCEWRYLLSSGRKSLFRHSLKHWFGFP